MLGGYLSFARPSLILFFSLLMLPPSLNPFCPPSFYLSLLPSLPPSHPSVLSPSVSPSLPPSILFLFSPLLLPSQSSLATIVSEPFTSGTAINLTVTRGPGVFGRVTVDFEASKDVSFFLS